MVFQKGPNDEVYFSVESPSEEEARTDATQYMSTMLQGTGLHVAYTIELQAIDRG